MAQRIERLDHEIERLDDELERAGTRKLQDLYERQDFRGFLVESRRQQGGSTAEELDSLLAGPEIEEQIRLQWKPIAMSLERWDERTKRKYELTKTPVMNRRRICLALGWLLVVVALCLHAVS